MASNDQLIVCYRAGSLIEAQFIVDLLADEGIDARSGSGSLPHAGLAAISVEVFVRAADRKRAADVVEAYEDQRFETVARDEDPESPEAGDEEPAAGTRDATGAVLHPQHRDADATVLDRWADVLLLLVASVFPSIWYAAASAFGWWDEQYHTLSARCVSHLIEASTWIALTLYLMRRRPEPWSTFGIVRTTLLPDFILGIGLWAIAFLGWIGALRVLGGILSIEQYESLFESRYLGYETPMTFSGVASALAVSVAWGLGCELALRGFLLPRFESLLASTWKSLVLVTALSTALGLHTSLAGVLYGMLVGLTLCVAFSVFRRLWPVVVAQTCVIFASHYI